MLPCIWAPLAKTAGASPRRGSYQERVKRPRLCRRCSQKPLPPLHPPGLKSGDWHHERGHAHFSLNLLKHYLALTALDSVDRWRACFAARQGISIIVWSAFGVHRGVSIFKGSVRESCALICLSGPCVLPSELETTIGTERKEKRSVATNWD